MTETRRMTSTAARINRSFMLRLTYLMLWLNIFVLVFTALGFCLYHEIGTLGSYWQPNIERSIQVDSSLSWWQVPGSLKYTFWSPIAQTGATVSGGRFMSVVLCCSVAVLVLEIMTLFSEYRIGKRRTQKLLTPFYRMAETAQTLDQSFDSKKYHDLEEAILHVDVATEDARIRTGDRDLQGMEDAVNGLLRRTHEAYRQQTRFVSDASHELRTPISVIRGYADMLDRWGKNDEKVRDEAIAAIRKEADNMQRLVEQLLFLARGDSGRQQLEMARVDLNAVLREVCEEMHLVEPEREFLLTSTEPVYAQGDIGMLKQCVRILTENAMRYSAKDERITLRAFINKKNESCLTVQDNGIGIRQEDLPHIFERFYRSSKARTRQGGTGLGLSLAKWIADAHNACFDVLSREGVGTRITLCLPSCEQKAL
ncbi:MAG: HAMP domain-containing histidine kinase [Clostridia bacterium]|nr:HAMP domain-containing histidine kinase [Clostridia bacterium]